MVPIVRLKKSYVMASGKRLGPGKIFRTSRSQAEAMISQGVAERYEGPVLHELPRGLKMKLNLKDL